jgi:acetyl-CoA carboxylase carboxyltransferase component
MFSFLKPRFINPFGTKKKSVTHIADSKNVQQANTEQEEAENLVYINNLIKKKEEEEAAVAAEMKTQMEAHKRISELLSGTRSQTELRRGSQNKSRKKRPVADKTLTDYEEILAELEAELERTVQVLGGTRKRRKNKKHKKHKKKLLSFKRSHIKY